MRCSVTCVYESNGMQEAFAFPKKSPYREAINYHLLRLRNEGVLDHLLWNLWKVGSTQHHQQQSTPMVAARQVVPALVVLVAAGVIALCLPLLENACCRRGAEVVCATGGCKASDSSYSSHCSLHPMPPAAVY
ncbi:uncharacterized protein LOC124616080 [Schistocerca americana]|uniref:uncharacterized protein LOC124616080 n=1 Tax=Schistocerca americana TaxID=7009 RepID=UPI001F4F5B4A|nr:uncharacterized protein LOC124616080 [Schistocerca americana]